MLCSPTMRTAVLQTTMLCAISMLYSHHFTQNMFDQVTQDESWMKMVAAVNSSMMPVGTPRGNGQLTLDAGNSTNTIISLNQTAPIDVSNGTAWNHTNESFYGRTLPRELAVFVVYSALRYWWLVGLERLLPARSRNKEVLSQLKEQVEGSEDREEAVIKKWIAQGRVRRASLNWCNTFMKWALDMTIGILWLTIVAHVLRTLLKFQSPSKLLVGWKSHLAIDYFATCLSVTPFARLVAFVVVPAHRQIVFVEGVELAATIFLNTLVRVFATWAVKTNYVQVVMKNVTDAALEKKRHGGRTPKYQRYYDEI